MARPLPRFRYAVPLAASLAAGAATVGGALALADYVVRQMTAPAGRRRPINMGFTPFETGADCVEATFPGGHDSELQGWLLLHDRRAPTILTCGGHRAHRADLLGIASALWRAGYNVLLFDYTGYGDEPGPVTLGYWELADAQAALRFLRQEFPEAPLGVMGFSMGAAVAIMLAAREPDVQAVCADSPFSSQPEIVRYHVARRLHLTTALQTEWLARLVLSLVDRRLSRLFGFRLADVDPLRDVVKLAPRPLFLVHGEADNIIPVEQTRRMAAAARGAGVPVTAWFLPGAGHCEAYFFDRTQYCSRVADFFGENLLPPRDQRGRRDLRDDGDPRRVAAPPGLRPRQRPQAVPDGA